MLGSYPILSFHEHGFMVGNNYGPVDPHDLYNL